MIRLNHDQIARLAHESFREQCILYIDAPPARWADARPAQRQSMLGLVARVAKDRSLTPQRLHEEWLAERLTAGWSVGPMHDTINLRSPMVVPWAELSPKYRSKQGLVFAIIHHLLYPGEGT